MALPSARFYVRSPIREKRINMLTLEVQKPFPIDHVLDAAVPTFETMMHQLQSLWALVLDQDVDDIAEDDMFFELGGDSITALKLSTAAQRHGIRLSVEQIFTHASLRDMAEQARFVPSASSSRKAAGAPPYSRLQPFELLGIEQARLEELVGSAARECFVSSTSVENMYPLTPMQQALMTASDGDENIYLRQLVYRLAKDVAVPQLQAAWNATVRSNPLLRTRIPQLPGWGCLQLITCEDDIQWSFADNLSAFLERDSAHLMKPGNRFFRYALVTEGQATYFVWSVHHALCDGATVLEIQDEVSLRFHSESPPPRPNFDLFVKHLLRTDREREKHYWQTSLSNMNATPFPVSHIRDQPPATSYCTVERQLTIDYPWPGALPQALLLRATWAILLSYYTGNQQVVFGTILSGRNSPAFAASHGMIGPTINLLPIALTMDPEETVSAFMTRVRHQAGELAEYEHSSISNIRRYTVTAAGASGSASVCDFQNIFVVQPLAFGEAAAPALDRMGLRYTAQHGKLEQHRYPLVVSAYASSEPNLVTLQVQYDERHFDAQSAQSLGNHYRAVLERLCRASSNASMRTVTPWNHDDLTQIKSWNSATPPAEQACFHWHFQNRVYTAPYAEAVRYSDGSSLSYAEVDNLSSALASRLIDLDIGPGTSVAICMEKCIWTPVAMLAVFKAGGAFVPMDPGHPRSRLAELIKDVRIRVAVTSQTASGVFDGLLDHVVAVQEPQLTYIQSGLGCRFRERAQPSDAAYIMFTSGSTGEPKGVVITHSALCTSILDHGRVLGAGPHWRMLQFASHTFDASITELLTTLISGGCVCIPSEHGRMNDLTGEMSSMRVNAALLTPTVANMLEPGEVPDLRLMVLGGEPVTREVLARWGGRVQLVNAYGPTEASVICSLNPGMDVSTNPARIGRSVGGTMWIVDADNHRQLAAIGCVGEIVISGATLARGYHDREDLTRASFPLAPSWLLRLDKTVTSADRIYKTGDLGRYDPDGAVQILGRKDTQIKLRGMRVELGEVESQIIETGGVTAAVAIVSKNGPCARQIAAVVCVSQQPQATTISDGTSYDMGHFLESRSSESDEIIQRVKNRLALTLPAYMIPTVWLVFRTMPILASGKMNRRSLTNMLESMDHSLHQQLVGTQQTQQGWDESAFAQDDLANALRQVWSDVLGVPLALIGPHTSFFSLGGDSVSAIQIIPKAKLAGISLVVGDILRGKTLARILATVAETAALGSSVPRPGTANRISHHDGAAFGLSPIQKWYMTLQGQKALAARFHQAMVLDVRRPIPADTIQEAFSVVVERHEMLRAAFLQGNLSVEQQIPQRPVSDSYRFHLHRGLTPNSPLDDVVEQAHSSISAGSGRVFSVDVLEDTGGSTRLVVVAHHLVVDLVSWRILLHDVQEHIEKGSLGTHDSLSFHQWTQFLRHFAAGEGPHDEYQWKRQKQVVEQETAHFGFRPEQNSYAEALETRWSLDQSSTSALLSLAGSDMSTAPVELMIAATSGSFSQVFNRPCPTLMVEGHGREPPPGSGVDLSSTVGWFTVMYPISGFPDSSGTSWLRRHLKHVQAARAKYPDNGLGYFSSGTLREPGATQEPVTQPIQFNYHGKFQQFESDKSLFSLVRHPGLDKTQIGPDVGRSSVFQVEIVLQDDRLHFSLAYPAHLPCSDQVAAWSARIKHNLEMLPQILALDEENGSPSLGPPTPLSNASRLEDIDVEYRTWCEDQIRLRFGQGALIKVEDIYPCSPMQHSMLSEQAEDPSVFILSWDFEVSAVQGPPLSLNRVRRAWRSVVAKHPILRTAFVRDPTGRRPPQQVLLAGVEPDVELVEGESADEEPLRAEHGLLPHRARFFASGDVIRGRIELSHALIDGWSLGLIKSELLAAYEADLTSTAELGLPGLEPAVVVTPYKAFVQAHTPEAVASDKAHWALAVRHPSPTLLAFPPSPASSAVGGNRCGADTHRHVYPLAAFEMGPIAQFCRRRGVTVASVVDAAWAETLVACTGRPDVSFAYVVSGRDTDVDVTGDALAIVGPLINVLAYRLRGITAAVPGEAAQEVRAEALLDLAAEAQEQRNADGRHAHCSVLELLGGRAAVCNTLVNYQRRPATVDEGRLRVRDLESSRDPWPFDVVLRVLVDDALAHPQLEYNTGVVGREEIAHVAKVFGQRLQVFSRV